MSQSSSALVRRFYKNAAPTGAGSGFAVALDGKTAKTPAGAPLVAPTEALTQLLCDEWNAQGEGVDFSTMPATRLAFTAIDRVSPSRRPVAAEVARFADNDLLCFFADYPDALVRRQEQLWGPWLTWAKDELGVELHRATGISAPVQSSVSLARAEALAQRLDDFVLAGLASASALFGSAILAFAMHRQAISAEAAFDLSRLDEAFQEEQWGIDAEAATRTASLRREAKMLGAWFDAL